MAVYFASKAYVLSFSEALATEVADSGVTVTALCPGPTTSNFQAAAGLADSKLVFGKKLASVPRFLPRAMVAKIVRAAQERRRS